MQSAVEGFETEKLCGYLERHIDGFRGPMIVRKFVSGQSNPTFKLETASGIYVLRRQPPGKLLQSAHAVDREFRVINALKDTDVPVATSYHLCEDRGVIGSMFYVMDFCDGRIFFPGQLPDIDNNRERSASKNRLARYWQQYTRSISRLVACLTMENQALISNAN